MSKKGRKKELTKLRRAGWKHVYFNQDRIRLIAEGNVPQSSEDELMIKEVLKTILTEIEYREIEGRPLYEVSPMIKSIIVDFAAKKKIQLCDSMFTHGDNEEWMEGKQVITFDVSSISKEEFPTSVVAIGINEIVTRMFNEFEFKVNGIHFNKMGKVFFRINKSIPKVEETVEEEEVTDAPGKPKLKEESNEDKSEEPAEKEVTEEKTEEPEASDAKESEEE